MEQGPADFATYFDEWYADMAESHGKDALVQRHLGLPPDLLSTSLLGWEGLGEVVAELRLDRGDVLLDLACGRGGYGLGIAARTGASLIGVDFSAEAVRQANVLAQRRGQAAEFRVGDLAATGLPDASVRGVACIDAIQFAVDLDAALTEVRRVLAPGGRVALTCWQALDPSDDSIPARLHLDLESGLTRAGLADVVVRDRPEWLEQERALWDEAAGLDPGDDAALRSLHEEAERALVIAGRTRRVLATATAP